MSFTSSLQSYGPSILAGIAALGTIVAAFFWSKYPIRWFLAVCTIALALIAFLCTKINLPEIDSNLPPTFRDSFPFWIFGLGLIVLYSLTHLVATLFHLTIKSATGGGADGPFADIQAAWRDILIQLSQARIDPAAQELFLLLTPEESLAASLVGAAGLQFFAQGPTSAEAPIHAYAISEALLLSCGGASNLGCQDGSGTERLEFLCRLIESLNAERPILRGIAILVPFEWTQSPNSLRQISAIRDDLQTIRRVLKVRCPTLTVCCLQESIPGFNDFASRLPAKLRHLRCGFSVPLSQGTEGAVIRRGMVWMMRWFQVWSLSLMVNDIHNKDGNGRLLSMNVAIRAGRDALTRLLESGLTVHQQDEPILYRGCYFVACGPTPEHHAFAAGIVSGAKKGRLLADRALTTWSREADHLDRTYRRMAYALGIASTVIASAIWIFCIRPNLGEQNGLIAWVGLVALGLVWAGVLLQGRFRRKQPA